MNLINRQTLMPTTMAEAERYAEMLARSTMVPKQYQNNPSDTLVAISWGFEIGLAPLQALQNISVINGKPSVYGDAALAMVQASPVCEGIEESIEGEGTPNPVAICVAKRKNRTPVTAKFSVEDAKKAGLWGKQGPWTSYPKRMLQMRARGFALRDAFPDVLKGLITSEEAHDYPDEAKPKPMKDVMPAPANPLDMIAPPAPEAKPEPVVEPEVVEVTEVVEEVSVVEIVDIPEVTEDLAIPMYVPTDTDEPKVHSTHPTAQAGGDELMKLMKATAHAGKRPVRERMSILKKFRSVNDDQINKIGLPIKSEIISVYNLKIRHLGAQLTDEKATDTA